MSEPNLVLRLAYVQNEDELSKDAKLYLKYGDKRRFYSCNQEFNYVSYTNRGSKEKTDYVAYSGDREKSFGVFGQDGLMNKKEQSTLKSKLRDTKSIVWYGVIAPRKEFGDKYLGDNEDAMRLMKTEMPRFLKSAGLNPDNVTWYAGLHENTQKKHIHFSFFENAPMRFKERHGGERSFSKGKINLVAMDGFKVRIEQRLTDITAELKSARSGITDVMRNILFSPANRRKYQERLQDKMLELAELLPAEGRLSYNSENMKPLVPKVREIVDTLIKSSPEAYAAFNRYAAELLRRDGRTKEILKANKIDGRFWDKYLIADKALDDVYRRLGNTVIGSAKFFKGKEKRASGRLAWKWKKKRTTAAILTYCLKLNADAEREALDAFREYMERLNEEDEMKNGEREMQHESEM